MESDFFSELGKKATEFKEWCGSNVPPFISFEVYISSKAGISVSIANHKEEQDRLCYPCEVCGDLVATEGEKPEFLTCADCDTNAE